MTSDLSFATTKPASKAKSRPLAVALPARWSRLQRCKNTCLYGLLRGLSLLWRLVPRRVVGPASRVIGLGADLLARRERAVALRQMAAALPHLSAAERRRMVRRMFIHLARAALELGRLPALLRGPRAVQLPEASRQVMDAALAEGRGVVAVTGHIGNWELMAQVVAHAGYPLTTVAKPLYDPRLTRWVQTLRGAFGMHIIWRGETGATRELLRVFRRGHILALLIDQDTRVEGTFVPFFGRPAFTPTAAATLALRFDAPVVVAWSHFIEGTHRITFERLHAGACRDPAALTARITARLEEVIRREPAQWVWLHERWRRQPVGALGPS